MALVLYTLSSDSQTNNLTGSPYSLFGLGVDSNTNTGRNSGLGKLGFALESKDYLNLYNPASFASIEKERFVFDFGFFTEVQSISSNDGNENRFASNFSNFAIGFNGNGKYGLGLSLKPSTTVGYALIGVESNIEGSNEMFTSNILGSGGLNEVRLDYGRSLNDNFKAGVRLSYLFGNVEETESILTESSFLTIDEINRYNGLQVGLGLQYKLKKQYNLGLIIDAPTVLNGKRDTTTQKFTNSSSSILEDETGENIDDFFLPLKIGFGVSKQFKNFLVSADYSRSFWTSTNQSDNLGDYTDQNIFALGAEYIPSSRSLKYWKRINFRAGLNYDTGNLKINGINIDNYSASLGLGLPLGVTSNSYINLSYNTGRRGSTDSFLVEENFNTFNINITLSGIWFQKRKYD